jgi:hypothetical protein
MRGTLEKDFEQSRISRQENRERTEAVRERSLVQRPRTAGPCTLPARPSVARTSTPGLPQLHGWAARGAAPGPPEAGNSHERKAGRAPVDQQIH